MSDFGKGSPANPISYAELEPTFGSAPRGWLPADRSDAVTRLVGQLEQVADVRGELTTLLQA